MRTNLPTAYSNISTGKKKPVDKTKSVKKTKKGKK